MTRTAIRTRRLVVVGLVLVIGLVFVFAFYWARSSARESLVREARIEGLIAYHDGDYETALQKLSSALRNNRRDVEVLLAFADTRSRIPTANNRHLPEAAHLYTAVLEVEPANLAALVGVLRLYEQLYRHVEWMEIADRILAIEPNHIDALRLKAAGHRIHSQFELATEAVLRLIELEPDELSWRGFRLALLRDQDAPFDEMLVLCQQWIDEYSGDGRYHMMKAQLLTSNGQIDSARGVAAEAVRLGASAPEVLRPMLSLLDALQLRDEADELVRRTKRDFAEKQWPQEAAVRRFWQHGRFTEALDQITMVKSTVDGPAMLSRELLRWESLLLVLTGRYDEAETVLDELRLRADVSESSERDADRAWAAAMDARMQMGEGNWQRTLSAYTSALALSPVDPVLHFLAGEVYAQLGEHELAVASFERAHRSDPNWHAARLHYADAMINVGKPRAAYAALLDMVQRREGGIMPYVLFARAWLAAGEPTDVLPGGGDSWTGRRIRLLDLLQYVHEAVPESTDIREVLARVALRYGEEDVAIDLMQQALAAEDADARLLGTFAQLSLIHGVGLERELAEKAQQISGTTPPIAAVLARIHYAEGQTETAFEVLDEAIKTAEDAMERSTTKRVRAAFLVEINHPSALDALTELLEPEQLHPITTHFLLAQPLIWENPHLVERAIDSLASSIGEGSPRLALLRANFILRHQADRPAEMARAKSMIADVLDTVPDSLVALKLMAQLALAGDQPNVDLAIRYLERAIAVDPDQGELYVQIVSLYQKQGNYREADRYLGRLGGLAASDPSLLRAEIELLEMQGNYEGVVSRLTQFVDQTGNATETERLLLFSRLHMAGRHAEAERLISQMLHAEDPSELTVRLAAEFYANNGRYEQGLALIKAYEPTSTDGGAAKAVLLGRYYQQNGRLDEAMAAYEDALQRDSSYADAIVQLAQLHAIRGDSRAAYEAARQGLEKHPDNADLQSLLLMTSVVLGDRERSYAMSFAEASEIDPALLAVSRLLGRVPGYGGGGEEAPQPDREHLEEARRIVERHPHSLSAWNLAIELNLAAGRRDDAIRLATQAAARNPNRAEPARRAALLLSEARRIPEALEMGRLWQQRSLNQPIDADLFIANMAMMLQRHQEAADHLKPHTQRLLAEHQQHPQRLAVWMYIQLRSGFAQQVVASMKPIFEESDEDGAWRHAYMEAVSLCEQPAARAALEAIQSLFVDEPIWRLALASGWSHYAHRFGDPAGFGRAEAYARSAGQDDEELLVSSLMIRAQNADWRRDEHAAEDFFRNALSLAPENAIILNNLADLIVRVGGRCDEAVTMAARAAELAPEFPEIIDTHANALLCLDDFTGAERLARKALAERPDSPYFLTTLGLTLAAQERWDEARSVLHKVDQIMSESDQAWTPALLGKIHRLRGLIDDTLAVSG